MTITRIPARLSYALREVTAKGHDPSWWHERLFRRLIRPYCSHYLPHRIANYHGVAVEQPVLDPTPRVQPEREAPLIRGIERNVRRDDHVVIVGGGYGVSTAISAWATGPDGRVDVYEGSEEWAAANRRLVERANVDERVTVHEAIVGDAVDVWGRSERAPSISPGTLDPGDLLVMDCEGAEMSILMGLSDTPRAAVVECHPDLGADDETIRRQLRERFDRVSSVSRDGLARGQVFVAEAGGEAHHA